MTMLPMPNGSNPDLGIPPGGLFGAQPPNLGPNVQMPQTQHGGGMFGGSNLGSILAAALSGYAASSNPGPQQALFAALAQKRRQAEEESQYQRERQDKQTDWQSQYDYELQHPKPINNDTANDYSFWQQHLSPQEFETWKQSKIDPPQYMNVPGVGLVQIPRGGSAAPTAPVGKLTPLGAGGPAPGPGGFHY